ncbi:MAG: hypothetical protein ACOYK8_02740 [Alphaproteobacteria bacterium]
MTKKFQTLVILTLVLGGLLLQNALANDLVLTPENKALDYMPARIVAVVNENIADIKKRSVPVNEKFNIDLYQPGHQFPTPISAAPELNKKQGLIALPWEQFGLLVVRYTEELMVNNQAIRQETLIKLPIGNCDNVPLLRPSGEGFELTVGCPVLGRVVVTAWLGGQLLPDVIIKIARLNKESNTLTPMNPRINNSNNLYQLAGSNWNILNNRSLYPDFWFFNPALDSLSNWHFWWNNSLALEAADITGPDGKALIMLPRYGTWVLMAEHLIETNNPSSHSRLLKTQFVLPYPLE